MLEKINSAVWGEGLLFLILATGLFLSFKMRFFQFTHFGGIIKNTIGSLFRCHDKKCDEKSITPFQALSTALSATMGTGNIIGVASALAMGGAGAIFWMWISAVLGMMTIYAENYLGTLYRYKNDRGEWIGGAMAYMEKGLGSRCLAVIFSVCCILASFGMGNMAQISSISDAFSLSFSVKPVITGTVTAILIFIIIMGGIKRVGNVTQLIIPVLSAVYIISAFIIICINYKNIPHAFSEIINQAFSPKAAGGGICGTAVSIGLRRGVFSNEAGLGSSGMLHSASSVENPHIQGMWGIFEVFADTIVCCTLTALVILSTGAHKTGNDGVMLVTHAFSKELGGIAPIFISTAVSLFAFATIIGWFYCGECAVTYIFGSCSIPFYKFIFLISAFAGAVSGLEAVWTISDIFNGLMAIPNLTGLLLLRKEIMLPADQDKV